MILINFSHPLSAQQKDQVKALSGEKIERLLDRPVQFENEQPYLAQLAGLFENFPLSSAELQTEPLLVNLPSLNFIAGLVLAELHGRMGYFPPVLRLRLVPESLPPRYEVVEILNLQAVRERARKRRYD